MIVFFLFMMNHFYVLFLFIVSTANKFKDYYILAYNGCHVVYTTNAEIIEDYNNPTATPVPKTARINPANVMNPSS